MIVLFTVVAVAVVTLTLTRTDSMRPMALTAIGALAIALGGRSVALLTDVAYEPFAPAQLAAQEVEELSAPSDETVEPDEEVDTRAEVSPDVEDATEEAAAADTDAEPAPEATVETPAAATPDPVIIIDEPITSIAEVRNLNDFPEWTDAEAGYEDETYRITVDGGAYNRKRNAERALDDEIIAVANEHINDYLQANYAATLLQYDIDRLRQHQVVRDTFVGSQKYESLPDVMYRAYARLEFTPEFHQELDRRWDHVRATSRLAQTGLGGAVVLLLLGTVFGYFKLDTATRGYYTGRLQFGTAAVILVVIVVCIVLAKWIHWV